MRIAIIQFPGSNCERETILAVKRAHMEPVECLWNVSKSSLVHFDGFIIVGGFSYEDRSRAGVLAALDSVMDTIEEQSQLSKPVLGICNGAQILLEKGLVPGLRNNQLGAALTDNIRIQNNKILGCGYYNAWVNMRLSDRHQHNAFTRYLTPKNILSLPVAHGEGRFVIPTELLSEMQTNGQNLFQYCDAVGNIVNEFPVNPNGSVDNLAAISNKTGNVLALMPHPERTSHCDAILHSMRDYIAGGYQKPIHFLSYDPIIPQIQTYHLPDDALNYFEMIVDSNLTDNHALSVEGAIQNLGISVKIKRYVHWEIICESVSVFEKIKSTGVLFNDQKERVLNSTEVKDLKIDVLHNPGESARRPHTPLLLVRPKENIQGKQTLQILKKHFNIQGLHSVSKSILWEICSKNMSSQNFTQQIIQSHILYNPYAHDCFKY